MGEKTLVLKIATVLKVGEWRNRGLHVEYFDKHVEWVKKQIEKYVSCEHEFICLSDIDLPYTVPLAYNLPGWWSKMELFRDDLELDDVFYLDLDTVIIDDITHIVSCSADFMALRNLSSPTRGIGSGLMRWKGDYSHLFDKFIDDPFTIMDTYIVSEKWGDQGFIQDNQSPIEHFQDRFPEEIVSFKFDLKHGDPREKNKIVVFHGKPKPWEVDKEWIMKP